jgi:hypothetical protein
MVMPTKIPMGHLNFTAGSNDGAEIEMPFVGVPHIGKAVNDIAIQQLNNVYKFMNAGDFVYEG